jgi:ABC-type iron transport system FetAB ATPase subunit
MPMSYQIRPLTSGKFAIDNGDELLTECPCCGKSFTKLAVQSVVEKLDSGQLTWDDAKVLAAAMAGAMQ